MNTREYSEEVINAFIDDELDHHERLELLEAASRDDTLRQKVCEAQHLKEMVREAYPVASDTAGERRRKGGFNALLRYGAAALLGGLTLFSVLSVNERIEYRKLVTETSQSEGAAAQPAHENQRRVLFHISSDDHETAQQLLEQVELVLREHEARGEAVRVEVVANNQGLRLLQQGRSRFAAQIRELHQRYPSLVFAACGNTMERFRKRYGENITVLPEAVVVRSGVSLVARRQEMGWSYIKV
ncbi:MAG: hypothetical protein ABW153_17035 [Sedimenticola sp.]